MILGVDNDVIYRCYRDVPIRPFTAKWGSYACIGYTCASLIGRIYTAETTPDFGPPETLDAHLTALFLLAYLYYTILHPLIRPIWIILVVFGSFALGALLAIFIPVALVYLFLVFNPTVMKDLYDEYRCLMAPLAFMQCHEMTALLKKH
jgi:hypothetical protein